MKKFLCVIAALMLLGFSGCTSRVEHEEAEGNKTLIVLDSMGWYDAGAGLIRTYLPDYTIEYLEADDPTVLMTQIMAGEGPDIMNGYWDYGTQLDMNLLRSGSIAADLLPLLEQSGLDLTLLHPALLDSWKKDGALYCLPIESGPNALITSQETLMDSGIELQDSMTAHEFFKQLLAPGVASKPGKGGLWNAHFSLTPHLLGI